MAFTVLLRCRDLERGLGRVVHPNALDCKYLEAGEEGGWQWVFRASQNCTDPMTRTQHRQHLHESVMQKAVKESARQSAIAKPASCHTSPIPFATPLLETGYDIRPFQELLGYKEVSTTMIDTHVLNKGGHGVRSPVDGL